MPVVLRQSCTPVPAGKIVNGGFECGPSGWTEDSEQGFAIILSSDNLPVPPHGGNWAAWLGGAADETSVLEQTVTIAVDRPFLVYWLWIASEDVCDDAGDVGGVFVDESIVDEYELCVGNNTGGWIRRSVDLSAYAGQEVALAFVAFADATLNSNMFVDDVSLQSSAALAPAPAPAPAAPESGQEIDSRKDHDRRASAGHPSGWAYRLRLLYFLRVKQ